MPLVRTRTIYLEMRQAPEDDAPAWPADADVTRSWRPSNEQYRQLYRAVGERFNWVNRLMMPDDELARLLQDDRVEVWVLRVAGETAGYVELDCRSPDVEIVYFGLLPAFIGRGLGRRFLRWVVDHVWAAGADRLWLHTCDLDHQAALPNYLKAGFVVYDERIVEQRLPDDA